MAALMSQTDPVKLLRRSCFAAAEWNNYHGRYIDCSLELNFVTCIMLKYRISLDKTFFFRWLTTQFYLHVLTFACLSSFMCVLCSFHFCRIAALSVNAVNFPRTTKPFLTLRDPVISTILKLLGYVWRKQLIRNDSSIRMWPTSFKMSALCIWFTLWVPIAFSSFFFAWSLASFKQIKSIPLV